jgi:hypothetical protein
MSTKSVKRKFEWILENVKQEKLEVPNFFAYSEPFVMKIGNTNTEW